MTRAFVHEPWVFQGEEFNEVPPGFECFVYLLTDVVSGKRYIGKKSFVSVSKIKEEGKRTKHVKRESDWKKYYSSNLEIQQLVKGGNGRRFHREILWLCPNKGSASYLEAKELLTRGCLEQPNEWYNYYLEIQINGGHLKLEGVK